MKDSRAFGCPKSRKRSKRELIPRKVREEVRISQKDRGEGWKSTIWRFREVVGGPHEEEVKKTIGKKGLRTSF